MMIRPSDHVAKWNHKLREHVNNIMVGRVGTDPMTGVSIVNSLLFVWNLCVFGGLSGIGIFTAWYCGKRDLMRGFAERFDYQIILSVLLGLARVF